VLKIAAFSSGKSRVQCGAACIRSACFFMTELSMSNTSKTPAADYQHQRGEIKDNKLKAVLTSPLFRTRVVKAKKGKGSYNRKADKQQGRQSKGYAPVDFYRLPQAA